MATFGNASTAWVNFLFSGGNTLNQNASGPFTIPEVGLITDLFVYVSGDGQSTNMVLGLWDTSGNLLAQTSSFTCPSGSRSLGGQGWRNASLITPYFAQANDQFLIGFWRDATKSSVFCILGPGSFTGKTNLSGSIGSHSGAANWGGVDGYMGAYAQYTPGGVFVKQGSGVWTPRQLFVKQSGGGWTQRSVFVKQGDGTWKQRG